ncbi:hypothetical protein E4N78_10715 [Treponema denticola]|nr:hypothetical protein E4N78_10715 [Treponema denticola]
MGINENIKPCPIIAKIKMIRAAKGNSGTASAALRAFENGRIKGKINKSKTSISPTKKSDIISSQIRFKELV